MIFLVLFLLVWILLLEIRCRNLAKHLDYDIEMIYAKLEQKQYEIDDLRSKIKKDDELSL